MPQIPTNRDDIRALTGLHLWHAGLSNCSQRVRLVLEEKGLGWTSHLVDLFRFEHATPQYQTIHPKGLVPALVHDGRTIIDSNDIIAYLDATFPEPPMHSAASQRDLLELADDNQLCIRTLSHEFMFSDHRRYDAATLAAFDRNHHNSEFARFLRQFATEGFSEGRLRECFAALRNACVVLDTRLMTQPWLTGEVPGLADFSWAPNVHRFALFDFPLAPYPHLRQWFEKMMQRPSYGAALVAYETAVPPVSAAERERRRTFFAS
ncbi:MAG: Glutathione S-transferase, N-terminal domain [Caulobacteraceae bacterium]|nr:Glutathione S-transferase, N-terminal domain [Caulobacteraceae bacterium]